MKHKRLALAAFAVALFTAVPVTHAATEWPDWSLIGGSTQDALGSFADGRTVIATLNVSSFKPAGTIYTADPFVPGQPGGGNPPYIQAPTGVPGEMIFTNDVIATFDLSGFPVNPETVFGLADMVDAAIYRIEILDAMSNPLSLEGLEMNNYNLFYPPPSGLVADLNIDLDPLTGLLTVNPLHDAGTGSTYIHSGLALFSNLPAEAEMIRILSGQDQLSEGVQFYFGASASIPVPPALWLFGSGLVGLAGMARGRWSRDRPSRD